MATGTTLNLSPTCTNGASAQVSGYEAATSTNTDSMIERARQELGPNPSGTAIGKWHRANIGPISQENIAKIRDALTSK